MNYGTLDKGLLKYTLMRDCAILSERLKMFRYDEETYHVIVEQVIEERLQPARKKRGRKKKTAKMMGRGKVSQAFPSTHL